MLFPTHVGLKYCRTGSLLVAGLVAQNKKETLMKTLEFNVIKKNRKFFKATIRGYSCKILIDANSEDMPPGVHRLRVNDESICTGYGKDMRYSLYSKFGSSPVSDKVNVSHGKNVGFISACKKLGGLFDGNNIYWKFSPDYKDAVAALDAKYNSNQGVVELTAKEDIEIDDLGGLHVCGYKVVGTSSTEIHHRIKILSGGIEERAWWFRYFPSGTVLRLEVSLNLVSEIAACWDYRITKE